MMLILGGNPPRLEGEVLNTQVVVQCPLSNPPTHHHYWIPPACNQFHLFAAMNFQWKNYVKLWGQKGHSVGGLRSGRWQDLKWNLLCFTYPPLPLSHSLHQKPAMFYSGPGLGEGKGTGWVASTTCHHGFRRKKLVLSGLPRWKCTIHHTSNPTQSIEKTNNQVAFLHKQ